MPDRIFDAATVRNVQRSITAASDAVELLTREEQQQPSLVESVTGLRTGHGVKGFTREYLEEWARSQNIDFDHKNPTHPYSMLSVAMRATPLTAGPTSTNGGYLVSAENQELIDIFRPYSPLLKSGVTVIGGLQSNAIFPRVVTDVTGQWLSSETVSLTEAPPVLGAIATSPHTFGITVRWTRQMQLQAPNLELSLRQICAKAAIEGVDSAAIIGPDTVGQPLGLLNSGGIGLQTAAAATWANVWTTRTSLANLNVTDDNVSWLAHPGVRQILATRENASGDSYIWNELDYMTGRPARISTILPSATMICGDFSQMCYAFFGPGFSIETTPFNSATDFQVGNMTMRLMVSVDTILLHPTAFVAVTGIT